MMKTDEGQLIDLTVLPVLLFYLGCTNKIKAMWPEREVSEARLLPLLVNGGAEEEKHTVEFWC